MIIAKYNIAPGSGSNATVGSTAVAGGSGSGYSVDLTPITEKIAELEAEVSQLRNQLNKVNAAMAALDGKYLSKLGDRSDYSYYLGALYTDFLQSEMFANGVGFRMSGNATASVDDKYNLIIKDVGFGSVTWNTVQQDSANYVDHNTDEATEQLNVANVSIGATSAEGFLLLDCGATLTNERCFTIIDKRVEYSVRLKHGQQIEVLPYTEAEQDANGNFILLFTKADNVTVSIRFTLTYAFRQFGDITSGTYRLYIRGTDPTNNRTDCFAASVKTATLNASGLTIINGNNGTRLTSAGVQHSTDGGTTWS